MIWPYSPTGRSAWTFPNWATSLDIWRFMTGSRILRRGDFIPENMSNLIHYLQPQPTAHVARPLHSFDQCGRPCTLPWRSAGHSRRLWWGWPRGSIMSHWTKCKTQLVDSDALDRCMMYIYIYVYMMYSLNVSKSRKSNGFFFGISDMSLQFFLFISQDVLLLQHGEVIAELRQTPWESGCCMSRSVWHLAMNRVISLTFPWMFEATINYI